ncbi:hint domain protein [Vibrio phage 1.161.O._10N.261.48.C5]|nr:hint domain protein [Vibrio phage 1.161.O._10N.261.48.C5]
MTIKKYLGINIDYSRDKIIPEQGYAMLTKKGFYKKEGEYSPQESFARATTCFSFGDLGLAQRLYDAVSKQHFTFASPVLSNAVKHEYPEGLEFKDVREYLKKNVKPSGLPISCFLSYIPDTREGLVDTGSETRYLSMNGGGVGLYAGMRSVDEKSTGVMSHMKTYDADAQAYKQGECYLPDTEILTEHGWKRFNEIQGTEKVVTVLDDNTYAIEDPLEWTEHDFSGKMFNFSNENRGFSVTVTPNHRMMVNRKSRKHGWDENYASVFAKDLKMHNEVRFNHALRSVVPEVSSEVKFQVALSADGHKHCDGKTITFHFSKERKIIRMRNILDNMRANYTESEASDGTTNFFIYGLYETPKGLVNLLHTDVTPEAAAGIVEEVGYWDSYKDPRVEKTYVFSGTVKSDADTLMALCAISGYGSRIHEEERDETRKKLYTVRVSPNKHLLLEKVTKTEVDYEGKVNCCIVRSGRIIVRSGETTLVCGNTRRGSYAAYLPIDHPEIMNFLEMRSPVGGDTNQKCFNLNNAINVTDDFMHKLVNEEDFELVDPKHGKTGRFLKTTEVWEKILEVRKDTGEPYLNFIDTINAAIPEHITNPAYKVVQSNLCNEIHLMTNSERTAVCCLSSLNLDKYDEWKDTTLVADMVRMLDNVLEYFIALAPDTISRAIFSAEQERAIGLGTLGFASYLQRKGVPFESGGFNSAVQHNHNIYKNIKKQAVIESLILGKERGVPNDCEGSGMRNSHLMAIAPNASSSSMVNVSPSIEPFAGIAFTAQGRSGSFLIKNTHFEKVINTFADDNGKDQNWKDRQWNTIVANDGSVQGLDWLDDHNKKVFKTSSEIDQKWVIEHAAIRQPHICQGQSLNLAIHPDLTHDEVSYLHWLAWKKKVKGLYYYRGASKVKASVSGDGTNKPLNAVPVKTNFQQDDNACLSCEG